MPKVSRQYEAIDGWQRLYHGFVFLIIVSGVGVLGYTLAGWNLIDAMYMVVITIFGVGYTEVGPIDSTGIRLFTMGLIISGCSALIYILGGFFQFIAEGEFNRVLGVRKMTREISQLKDHVIICGYGRLGRTLAGQLKDSDVKAIVLDLNEERIQMAADDGHLVYLGDASEEDTLNAVRIEHARALATVLPKDATNVFVTLTARAMSFNLQIVARGERPISEAKLYQAGANRVVIPARIGGQRLAHMITRASVTDYFGEDQLTSLQAELDNIGVAVDQLKVPEGSAMVSHTVQELETNGDGGFMVVAIKHANGEVTRNPKKDRIVHANDVLLVLGMTEDLPDLKKNFSLLSTKARSDAAAPLNPEAKESKPSKRLKEVEHRAVKEK